MSELTDEDEGKRTVAADGEKVGQVAEVDGATVYVSLENGVEANWGETEGDRFVLGANAVESIEESEVRLRGQH